LVKLFISEIVHTEDSFLLKLYYKFNFATEPLFVKEEIKHSENKYEYKSSKTNFFYNTSIQAFMN
ncbi:hypothetical protein ACQKH1_12840, partial [Staphylococcus capitis]